MGSLKPSQYKKRRFCNAACAGLFGKAKQAKKLFCKRGHPNIPENRKGSNCLLCIQEYGKIYREDGRYKAIRKQHDQKDMEEITRKYIACILKIKLEDLTDEMYEERKQRLLVSRAKKAQAQTRNTHVECKYCGTLYKIAPSDFHVDKSGILRYHVRDKCNACRLYPWRMHKGDVCQKCGFIPEHRSQLDVHHVDFNKKNNSPDNFITLCANCHRLVHGLHRDSIKAPVKGVHP